MSNYNTALKEMVFSLNLSIVSPKEESRREELFDFRISSAAKILEGIETGNTAFVADTGTGKTIVAFLVSLFLHTQEEKRTLFLVPQRILAGQHKALLQNIAKENAPESRVIIGTTKKKDRDWNRSPFTFATPQTFLKEMGRGNTHPTNFHFLVVDEFHKGQGKYAYVPLVHMFKEHRIPILPLSASPGGNEEKIAIIKEIFGIKHWIRGSIAMPEKKENVTVVNLDAVLKVLDQKFLSMFRSAEHQLKECGFLNYKSNQMDFFKSDSNFKKKSHILSQRELVSLKKEIDEFRYTHYEALSLYGIYMKLRHAYSVCMTESYHTFLSFTQRLEEKNASRGSRTSIHRFLHHPHMQDIINLAYKHKDEHPKALSLLSLANLEKEGRGIIFVGEKETGLYLHDRLSQSGLNTDILFGGVGKSLKHQNQVILSLTNGSLQFAISTSVVKEGLNIPEIGVVIHYSLSKTGIELIQGNGRVGRTFPGKIHFIILSHPLDSAMYWSAKRQLRVMRKVIEEKTPIFQFA